MLFRSRTTGPAPENRERRRGVTGRLRSSFRASVSGRVHPFDNPGAWRRATIRVGWTTKSNCEGSVGRPEARGRRHGRPAESLVGGSSPEASDEDHQADGVGCTTGRIDGSASGAPTEAAGSAQLGKHGVGSTEPTTGGASSCRRAGRRSRCRGGLTGRPGWPGRGRDKPSPE